MTITVQDTDLVTTGTAFTFANDFDSLLLTQGTLLGSVESTGISSSFKDHLIAQINGDVFAANDGVHLFGSYNSVLIGAAGSVSSYVAAYGSAVYVDGDNNTIVNRGSIISTGTGVSSFGDGVLIENSGEIYGRRNGVRIALFDSEDGVLINTGLISAGRHNFSDVANTGTFHGVTVEGVNTIVVNHGTIIAVDAAGAGINIGYDFFRGGSGTRVENTGTITSALFWGIDMSLIANGGASVTNFGLISGGAGGIRGSAGADTILNAGTIQGAVLLKAGADSYDGRDGRVFGTIFGGTGNDTLYGGDRDDSMNGGVDTDTLNGRAGEDLLSGGANQDSLSGGAGNDVLSGNGGDDFIFGGVGDDTISGGAGRDTMSGGVGNDIFLFASATDLGLGLNRDRITDYGRGDLIDLSGVQSGMTFIGAEAFSNVAGQIRYSAATGIIALDTDGDSIADFQLQLTNLAALTAASFVL